MIQQTSIDGKAKKAAGFYAAGLVQDGMRIGIGTGTTVFYLIEALSQRVKEGLKIEALATSRESESLAREGGIPLLSPLEVDKLDLAIDGADEIDPQKRMIKGGGGALLREKITAYMASEMVVIVDSSKVVDKLGKFPLPVEILPFGYEATLAKIRYKGQIRKKEGQIFVTDNGNYIFDIHLEGSPEEVQKNLIEIPGVIETGLFFHVAGRVVIGYPDGHVEER